MVNQKDRPKKPLAAVTIKKYLNGIQAWHIVRHTRVPTADREVIKALLTATARNKEEDSLVTAKKPVMVWQLFNLIKEANARSANHNLVILVALFAFWGITRPGELLRPSAKEGAILVRHVRKGENANGKFIWLELHRAKTAQQGQVQWIHLQQQNSILDPVAAVERILKANKRLDKDDVLFATRRGKEWLALTKGLF